MSYLDEVRARAEAATPGPIEVDAGNCLVTVSPLPGEEYRRQIGEFPLYGNAKNDSEFYAHSRTDIPELLRRLEIAENALDEIDLSACYGSEEDTDSQPAMLLQCGTLSRGALAAIRAPKEST